MAVSAKLARRRGGGVVGGGEGVRSVVWLACDDVSTLASALCVCDDSQELHNSRLPPASEVFVYCY